jgi:hypothetical protein
VYTADHGHGAQSCARAQWLKARTVGMQGKALDALIAEVLCSAGKPEEKGNKGDDKRGPAVDGKGKVTAVLVVMRVMGMGRAATHGRALGAGLARPCERGRPAGALV